MFINSLKNGSSLKKICVIIQNRSRDSSASIVTRLRIGRPGFDSRQRGAFFLFANASRPALGFTRSPIKIVLGALSPGVKRPGREADHSPPSTAGVKNAWRYIPTPPHVFLAQCLIKNRIQLHGVVLS
jgi:hypothetical protein